ncbi:hypothetical protein [Mesorhizobium sp.]|uniref:hypothetical protein n=1 Tax=Mesorhizobium sp. TaxID=1871066 RepID=UPI001212C163|nr:hypothetical protein [Mesorhizobium sp.]TIN83058.1 MAG: hypothetical protein E5X97_27375 [Mesorhizobium sp.]
MSKVAAKENQEGSSRSLPLGEAVSITGTVIGESRFANGELTYLVQFLRKGRPVSEWFALADLAAQQHQDGGGI